MGKVTQTFTTDDAKLLASYDKILRKQQDLLGQTMQLARESRRQSSAASDGFQMQQTSISQGIGGLARMAAGYATLRTAVNLVNSEIQKQIDLQTKAGQQQRTLANPRASLLQNLGAISPDELRTVKRGIDELAVAGYGERRVLTSAFGELASATPTYTNQERLATIETAAKFAPQPEELPTIAAGLGDVSGLTKSKNPEENLGVLAATAARSRGTQVSMVAENIVPASKNLLAYGATVPQALALPVAIQNETVDVEGRRSGTAALQTGEQLQEFFNPANVRERVSKEVQHEGNLGEFERPNENTRQRLLDFLAAEGKTAKSFEHAFEELKRTPDLQEKFFAAEVQRRTQGAKTLDEYISVLQRSPEEFQTFAAGFHGEEKQKGAVLRLLGDANSDVARQYAQFKAEGIPAGEQAAELGRQQIKNVQTDPNVAAQRLALAAENTADKIMTDSFRRGTAGSVREGLRQALESVNTRTVEMRAFMDAFNLRVNRGEDPIEAGQALLRKRAEYLTDPTRREMPFYGSMQGYEAAPVPKEQIQGASQLKGLAVRLDDIKADLEEGRAAEAPAEGRAPPPAPTKPQIDAAARRNASKLVPGAEPLPDEDADAPPVQPRIKGAARPRTPDLTQADVKANPSEGRARGAPDFDPTESEAHLDERTAGEPPGPKRFPSPAPAKPQIDAAARGAGAKPGAAADQPDLPTAAKRFDPTTFPGMWENDAQTAKRLLGDEKNQQFADEYSLLSSPFQPEDLAGHSEDFSALYDRANIAREKLLYPGAVDDRGQTVADPTRPPTEAELQSAKLFEEMLSTLKALHAAAVKAEQTQATANRQAAARGSRASGRE